ncbi:hypothetical protein GCM10027343_07680 [Noviherbaspirillum agri]
MASLAHAIQSFQNGGLSHHELYAQVDRELASDEDNTTRLKEILDDEYTRIQLPPDVYAELQRRAERRPQGNPAGQARHGAAYDETRAPTLPKTHSRTHSFNHMTPELVLPRGVSDRDADREPERMKGVGDTLNGRFVLEECIGFGGMGTVYKALDLRKLEASDRNPYIAIKVLNVQFRGHPKSLIALQREAKKAQTLAHPNIVTVYDFDRDGTMVYLTMEYLSGKPLSRALRVPDFKGMPFHDAMRIVTGVAHALSYAHQRGFVHCDLKPANIFVTDSGDVKVIDFGIARVFQKTEADAEATVFDPGSLGGLTPAYASPEMLEHREPDPRDDIYALACITYELLTGRHPFDRVPASQARSAGLKPQRPQQLGHRQWRALRAGLSFDRATRTPTVARFLQEMSDEQPVAKYAALAASGLVAAAVVAVGINYFQSRDTGGLPMTSGSSAEEAETAETKDATPPPPAQEAQTAPKAPQAGRAPETPVSLAMVTPILARVPCSALSPTVRNNIVQVQGYLPRSFDATQLRTMIAELPGVRAVNLNVQEVSEEKCAALKLLGPYWIQNQQAGAAASIQTKKPGAALTEGDYLVLDVRTPGFDSYVHVDYYAFDGGVVHLVPSPRISGNQAPPNYAATIGSAGNWVVSKPFGTDLIALLITPAPLFDGLRPESESATSYLRAVEKQLAQMANKYGRDKIAVDFVQITTQARKP